MTQRSTIHSCLLVLIGLLFLGGVTKALSPNEGTGIPMSPESVQSDNTALDQTRKPTVSESSNVLVPKTATKITAEKKTPVQSPWYKYPNACETFTLVEGTDKVKNEAGDWVYPQRHKRNRYSRKNSDTARTRDLVKLVVREMGGDESAQEAVALIASHESSWNPEAIHILNQDQAANQEAFDKYSYTRTTELALEAELQTHSAKSKAFWKAKSKLYDIRTYKDNPHWKDQLEYLHKVPERVYEGQVQPAGEWSEFQSVWTFGYGLYGMNAVLYTSLFDSSAPPWVMCGDEGIIATITIVWALRSQQVSCASLSQTDPAKYGTDGGNLRGVIRRFGRGQCSDAPLGKVWRKLLEASTMSWETVPNFGTKFTSYETYMKGGKRRFKEDTEGKKIPSDRKAIVDHMLKKASNAGLLRSIPLERKVPGSEPVIVHDEFAQAN